MGPGSQGGEEADGDAPARSHAKAGAEAGAPPSKPGAKRTNGAHVMNGKLPLGSYMSNRAGSNGILAEGARDDPADAPARARARASAPDITSPAATARAGPSSASKSTGGTGAGASPRLSYRLLDARQGRGALPSSLGQSESSRVGDEYQVTLPPCAAPLSAAAAATHDTREGTLVHAPTAAAAAARAEGAAAADRPQLFSFPLPAVTPDELHAVGGGADSTGEPSAEQERWLRWQFLKHGWCEPDEPLPTALCEPTTAARWSDAAERQRFDDALRRHGKHFREIAAELSGGRSVFELVQRYYESKSHKRLRQIDTSQATRNVRAGPCTTVGCQLHDKHAGPHLFIQPTGPRRCRRIRGEKFARVGI